jgi:hypothetical protein
MDFESYLQRNFNLHENNNLTGTKGLSEVLFPQVDCSSKARVELPPKAGGGGVSSLLA